MMVGDPKQSIYGFNSSGPEYMDRFRKDYGATFIELTENFRSSKAIVSIAKSLEPTYQVEGQLPIPGAARLIVGKDEKDEARLMGLSDLTAPAVILLNATEHFSTSAALRFNDPV
jgi:DNA helicase-2/ATP-dependent DNA helicase PcrA